MKHHAGQCLAHERPIRTLVVGAGGTGSQVMTALGQMDHALKSLGRAGLDVLLVDDDIVSNANVGRQWFFASDVGSYKSDILVNRVNMTLGTSWSSSTERLTASHRVNHDLVIGCVDTRVARYNIMRAMESGGQAMPYYLDFGNRKMSGQAILGQVSKGNRKTNPKDKLPHVGELFPEVMDPSIVDPDEGPSCSLAEALSKQSLFINRTLVSHGMAMLWELLHKGGIDYHGVFVNLETGRSNCLEVDPTAWSRFGYGLAKTKIRASRKVQVLPTQ